MVRFPSSRRPAEGAWRLEGTFYTIGSCDGDIANVVTPTTLTPDLTNAMMWHA
jgi:hypothetical protein